MYITFENVAQTTINKSNPRPCSSEGLIELGLYLSSLTTQKRHKTSNLKVDFYQLILALVCSVYFLLLW